MKSGKDQPLPQPDHCGHGCPKRPAGAGGPGVRAAAAGGSHQGGHRHAVHGLASRLAFTFLPFVATIPITFVKRIKRRQRIGIVLALILAMMVLMIMTLNSVSQVQKGAFIPYNASFEFWN